MKPTRSQIMLIVALVVVAALAWFAPKDEGDGSDLVEPSSRARQSGSAPAVSKQAASAAAESAALTPPTRQAADEHAPDLFKSATWFVPPPPPPAAKQSLIPPPPPPPPQAPPLPFTFMGRYDDGVKPVYMLTRGDLVVTASVGDRLDGSYQVVALEGNNLVINYLPLNQKQTLDVGVPR